MLSTAHTCVMLQDPVTNPLGLDDEYFSDPEQPEDGATNANYARVCRTRERGFRSVWFQQYQWLCCDTDYQIVGDIATGSVIAGEDALLTCRACATNLVMAPNDSLGAGSHSTPRGVRLMAVRRPDKFKRHNEDPRHVALWLRYNDPTAPPPAPTIAFKGVQYYQLQCLINVYDTVKNHESLASVERKRLLLKNHPIDQDGNMFDTGSRVSEYMILELLRAAAEWVFEKYVVTPLRRVKFVHGKVSDGTTDRSDEDAEVVGVQLCSLLGMPQQIFLGRIAVDYALSRDGLSPDAPAILGSVDRYVRKVLPHEVCDDHWRLTTGWSMDGASVNLGAENGVKGLLLAQDEAQHIHIEHGRAHVIEIACNSAYNSVEYFCGAFNGGIKDQLSHFNVSPKRQHLGQKFARLVGVTILKLVSIHGVRWQASLTRTLKALLRGWVPHAMAIHEDGKKAAKQLELPQQTRKLYLGSDPSAFVGLQFGRKFDGHGMCTGTVVSAAQPQPGANQLTGPIFLVRYQDGHEENLCKSQIVDCMEAGYGSTLDQSSSYRLYCLITTARWRWTLAFLADVKATSLKRLSELSQREALTPLSLNVKTDATLAELEIFKGVPGPEEAAFVASYDAGREMFDGLTVSDYEGAKAAVATDREAYLEHLSTSIAANVPASGPINEARIKIMDFSSIPVGSDHQTERANYGNRSIRFLVEQWWPVFMCSQDRPMIDLPHVKEAFVAEWQAIKARYNQSSSWQLKSNEQLRQLLYTTHKTIYPLFVELIDADSSDPLDTSCCERWISDQNLHKTNQRTSLSADTLNALMMISINGPPLAEVDWEAILTIWNNNTARGRYDAVWKADVAAQVADIRDLLAALD